MAEVAGEDVGAFGDELHSILRGDVVAFVMLGAGVPDGEDDASLGGAVDLDAEVAAGETAGFEIGIDGILLDSDLVVEPFDLRVFWLFVGEVNGGRAAL